MSAAVRHDIDTTAAHVLRVRQALCVTQAELAQLVGVRVAAVCRWEGKKHRPHPRHWRRLCELYPYRTINL